MRLNCRKIATIAIRHHQATGPRNCCRVLVLSTSGYYRWKNATPSARSLRRSSLTTEVCGEHERSHGVYGSPRIHAQLCKRQIHVNVKAVTHIMNDANILAKTVKGGIRERRKVLTRLRLCKCHRAQFCREWSQRKMVVRHHLHRNRRRISISRWH